MPTTTGEPNPILLFLLLFALILGVIGLMALISRAKAWLRGEPFFTHERLRGVNRFQGTMLPASVQATPAQQQPEAGIKSPVSVPVSVSGTNTAHFDLVAVPSDLTYEEVVTILARQVTPGGKPSYSGKKIYTLVGGNYNEFIALMRRLRAKDSEPAEPPPTTTPIAGRPTRAIFKEADPELAYNPPE